MPDYSRPEARRFAIENALYWLSDFVHGLRLDAVHAIPSRDAPCCFATSTGRLARSPRKPHRTFTWC